MSNATNDGAESAAPFALHGGEWIGRQRLWADALALAEELPERPHLFNLCEDRHLFAVTLLAAVLRRQVCLLPPSGQPGVVAEILADYPLAYAVGERQPDLPCPWMRVAHSTTGSAGRPDFDPSQAAVIAFTSGSTGRPKPCPHAFGTFMRSASMALESLGLRGQRLLVVSTTPPQHMYGLETSIFWPLFSDLTVYSGRPFFPEDIRRMIALAPLPVLLVSTPPHLRSLAAAGGNWHNLAGVISSTAPLSSELAGELEQLTGSAVREIYGSTETLSFAARRPALEAHWQPYSGASLQADGGTCLVSPHLEQPAELTDVIRLQADGRFDLLGRSEDMVKIAGKRISLAEMNRRLTDIDGVEDGLFQVVDDGKGGLRTLAVVVSSLERKAIREALRAFLDDVFLPRTIRYVPQIPRNEVGKVRRQELEQLLSSLKRQGSAE